MQRADVRSARRARRAAPTTSRHWLRQRRGPTTRSRCARASTRAHVIRNGQDDYPFVPVEGDGVHEIPVGPVHAGTIEPGHFRFSVVGERVLRLEERLGYKHKGIEKRFEAHEPARGRAPRRTRDRRLHRRLRLGLLHGGRRRRVLHAARARAVAARAAARARAHRQSPGRSGLSRQRCRARLRPGAVLAPEGGRAALEPRRVRPPLPDGCDRARRRRVRHRHEAHACGCVPRSQTLRT